VPAKETIKPGLLRDAIKNRKKKKKQRTKVYYKFIIML
jgi:hypothetical protein